MLRSPHLDLDVAEGIVGGVTPGGDSPRQVCIALADSLDAHHVKPSGARANIVIEGPGQHLIDSGAELRADDVRLRVTFACEPCAHGAELAEARMRDFRGIARYLAVIVEPGRITEDTPLAIQPGVYEPAPPDFRSRTEWALNRIPTGRVVTSLEFLAAIGASRSYLRAMPRWLTAARERGAPAHRVLTSAMEMPSWAPDAAARLHNEGITGDYQAAAYPLTRAIWR